jgi:hypothetical protein
MHTEYLIDALDSATGFTVLGNDTTNLAASTTRLGGDASLEFDKENGAANTVFAGAYKTINKVLPVNLFRPTDRVNLTVYVGAVTNVAYAFARIGTDASNYVEYRFADSLLTAGMFSLVSATFGSGYVTGTGWSETYVDSAGMSIDLDYLAVGVAFDAEANTLADIKLQRLYIDRNVLNKA